VIEKDVDGIKWCSYPSWTYTKSSGKKSKEILDGVKALTTSEFLKGVKNLEKVGWNFKLIVKEQAQLEDMKEDMPDSALQKVDAAIAVWDHSSRPKV